MNKFVVEYSKILNIQIIRVFLVLARLKSHIPQSEVTIPALFCLLMEIAFMMPPLHPPTSSFPQNELAAFSCLLLQPAIRHLLRIMLVIPPPRLATLN